MLSKQLLFKFFGLYTVLGICFVGLRILLFKIFGYSILFSIITNSIGLISSFAILFIFWFFIIKKIELKNSKEQHIREQEFQQSLKNIYDEHIFSITHELRSPLSVIAGSTINQMNNLKNLYHSFQKELETSDNESAKQNVVNIKRSIKTIENQVAIIENFIMCIAEHGSYINETNGSVHLSIYQYMYSVLMNCNSFSRSMKIFKNNILFGDGFGRDFQNIQVVVNPHDLSRIMMNIMNNAAEAIETQYNNKKQENPNYEPMLKIRCIKSSCHTKKLLLKSDIMRVNCKENIAQPFYLIIQDNGPGISDSHLKNIFNCGFSTKQKQKTHYGLGLHICRQLAEKNGLSFYIKTNNEGTMFIIGFPNLLIPEDKSRIYYTNDSIDLLNQLVEKEIECNDNDEIFVYFEKDT